MPPPAPEHEIQPPDLPDEMVRPAPPFDPAAPFEGALVDGGAVAAASGQVGEIRASVIRELDLSGRHLRGWRLTDVLLEGLDLSNADLAGGVLRRVRLERCRCTGLNLSEATLADVVFAGCAGDLLGGFGAALTRCRFQDGNLREADFDGAMFDRVAFRGCDLRGARLARIDLRTTDLRGSRIDGIVVSPDRLDGLTIEPAQAEVFAAGLGLRIRAVLPDEG